MSQVKPNVRPGGSYTKNPESGETTLVEQTKREKSKPEAKKEQAQDKAKKTAKPTTVEK